MSERTEQESNHINCGTPLCCGSCETASMKSSRVEEDAPANSVSDASGIPSLTGPDAASDAYSLQKHQMKQRMKEKMSKRLPPK